MMNIKRSPFFYVGDKYKLMPQLIELFPKDIDGYYEPFCGGGSSFLNTSARRFIVNDIDRYIIKLHKFFQDNAAQSDKLISDLYALIEYYGLSCSYLGIQVPDELKRQFVKTYYARNNKEAYIKMRADFNENQDDMKLLYLLLIYGFNHMIRFNLKGSFNLPVGNVDFNNNVSKALNGYFDFILENDISFLNLDYKEFLKKQKFSNKDFVYCDPPYLISQSEYNKLWDEDKERELYETLDWLDKKGVRFGLSNLVNHKGQENTILVEWMKNYKFYSINSNYISYNDNTIKQDTQEVYVTNG